MSRYLTQFISPTTTYAIGGSILGLFALEHLCSVSKFWYLQPSVGLKWLSGWSMWSFQRLGRGWAWFYVYLDIVWSRLLRFLQLNKLWDSACNILVPTFEIATSPWYLVVGFYNVTIDYAKPYAVPLGLSATSGIAWWATQHYNLSLWWLGGVPVTSVTLGWLFRAIASPKSDAPAVVRYAKPRSPARK